MEDKKSKYLNIVFSVICLVIIGLIIRAALIGPKAVEAPKKITEIYDATKFVNVDGVKHYDNNEYESIIGIDVSEHQNVIDWKQVSESGVKFAFIRVGYRGAVEGALNLDKYFNYNMEEAQKYGIDIGVYFFSSAITLEEVDEEIKYVAALIEDYDIQYPVVYDMEPYHETEGRINHLTPKEKTDFALEFCKGMESRGYLSMIYGNLDWLTNHLEYERIKDHEIWYAAYQEQPSFNHPFRMWQYSNEGKVNGIETGVDMNIYLKKK